MKKKRKRRPGFLLIVILVVFFFFLSVENLENGYRTEGKTQLEEAVRRAAVFGYATEGGYPPNLEYIKEHYGIRFDEARYMVDYQPVGSNLMPDITVLELDHEKR